MNHISGTNPTDAPTQAQHDGHLGNVPADTVAHAITTDVTDVSPPADAGSAVANVGAPDVAPSPALEPPGFGARGRVRRRVRFLRRARELAYRDLGGLVFNLHRFGQRNDELVMAKLTTLGQIDTELRALETALAERRAVTVLREAGITACARCAAIHSSEDNFCPNCGLAVDRNADLPIAGAASPPAPTPVNSVAPDHSAAPASPQTTPAPASPRPPAERPEPTERIAVGRAPTPPRPTGETPGEQASDEELAREEATEIIRPPASSS